MDAAQAPGNAPDTAQAPSQPASGGFFSGSGGGGVSREMSSGLEPNSGNSQPNSVNGQAPQQQQQATSVQMQRLAVPQEFRDNPSLSKFLDENGTYDPNVMLKSYVHSQSLIGADKVVIPKEGDEQGWQEVYTKLGRPADPKDYKVTKPEKMPDGMTYDEGLETQLRNHAFANGWNQRQFDNAFKQFYEVRAQEVGAWNQQQAKAAEESQRVLKREYGDGYQAALDTADVAMNRFGNDAIRQKLTAYGLQHDADIVRMFNNIGKRLIGETELRGAGANAPPSRAELESKITSYRTQYHAALYDNTHPEHKQRVQELTNMTQRLYGE